MSERPARCAKCGKRPWVIKEPDDYWYVGCTIQCGSKSEWDMDKSEAIAKWNETQTLRDLLRRVVDSANGDDFGSVGATLVAEIKKELGK